MTRRDSGSARRSERFAFGRMISSSPAMSTRNIWKIDGLCAKSIEGGVYDAEMGGWSSSKMMFVASVYSASCILTACNLSVYVTPLSGNVGNIPRTERPTHRFGQQRKGSTLIEAFRGRQTRLLVASGCT